MKVIKIFFALEFLACSFLGISQYINTSEIANLFASIFCFICAYLLFRSARKKNSAKTLTKQSPSAPEPQTHIRPSAEANSEEILPTEQTDDIDSASAAKQLDAAQNMLDESLKQLNDTVSSGNIFKVTVQQSNISSTAPISGISYVEDDKTISRADGKEITDAEIPHLIQVGCEEAILQSTNNCSKYMGMRTVSNIMTKKGNYVSLNDNEKRFFQAFHKQLIDAKLSPSFIKLTRMSDNGFNVDYIGLCYIGKVNLYQPPTKYAIIKSGNKRATKVFNSLQEAEDFVSQNNDYEIEMRQPKASNSMQYLRGLSTVKNLSNLSIEQCIEYIPYWIRYINYCKRN